MGKTAGRRNVQQREPQLEGNEKTRAKKRYVAPRLVEYGNLAKLTRGTVATGVDGAQMTACL